jgi:hypothetical protein
MLVGQSLAKLAIAKIYRMGMSKFTIPLKKQYATAV